MRLRESLTFALAVALAGPAFAAPPSATPDVKPPAAAAKQPAAAKTPKPVAAAAAKPEPPLPPADPVTLTDQARAAIARGDKDLAVLLAGSAIVADPKRPSSYDTLGDIYAAQNQPEFARNFYDKALAIDPADAAATKAIAALDRAGDKTVASDGGAKPIAP